VSGAGLNRQGVAFSRKRVKAPKALPEHLTCVAIIRDSEILSNGSRSHAGLRGYEPERPGDISGFMTSTGRFVTRGEAKIVGETSGQVRPGQRRELLSSDVTWTVRA